LTDPVNYRTDIKTTSARVRRAIVEDTEVSVDRMAAN